MCTVFFDVSYQSYVPSLISAEHRMEANGRLGTTQAFARLGGPGLGGGLLAVFGAAGAMTADAISYAVSVAAISGIRKREAPPPRRQADETLRSRIAEGLGFVVRHDVLRKVVACTGTANLFGGMASALGMIFLIRVLHVHAGLIGLIVAVSAAGGVAGGVFAGRLAERIGSARIIMVSILVVSAPQVVAPVAWRGWGCCSSRWVRAPRLRRGGVRRAQLSHRQSVTPPGLMGRMSAAVRWVVWGTLPLGAVLGGLLGTRIGVRPTLWLAHAGSWAAGWFVFFPPLRHMRDLPAPA